MKIKMWCLVDKKKNVPIQIAVDEVFFVVGFATKKDLLICTGPLLPNEEVRKIEVEVNDLTN